MILDPGGWTPWLLAIALLIDRFVIDPDRLWARIPHPVVGFGKLIDAMEAAVRHRGLPLRAGGILIAAALVGISILIGLALAVVPLIGPGLEALAAAILLAQRSLSAHVSRVAAGLETSLEDGRQAVAMIVGRDVSQADESVVSRAAIESLAENFSDGIVAPAFWFLLFGLPGIVAYKAINTADSMIGHRTPRHERIGWASARLDDLLNWVPSRLTTLLIAAAAASTRALRTAKADAGLHRSPNAGWPEAAMAGALGIQLGGPRRYGDTYVDEPPMNPNGRAAIGRAEIRSALRVYGHACWVLFALVLFVALFT